MPSQSEHVKNFADIVTRLTDLSIDLETAINETRKNYSSMYGCSNQEMDAIVNAVRVQFRK